MLTFSFPLLTPFFLFIARVIFFLLAPGWTGVYFYIQLDSTGRGDSALTETLHILLEAPTLVFLALYSQQVLVWAEAYYVGLGNISYYNKRVWPTVAGANALAIAVQSTLWVVHIAAPQKTNPLALSLAAAVLNALIFFSVAIAMTVLGISLNRSVSSAPLGLALRTASVRAVTTVNAICGIVFVARAIALAGISYTAYVDLRGFDESTGTLDLSADAVFFILTELVPLIVILVFHSPRKRLRRKAKNTLKTRSNADAGIDEQLEAAVAAAAVPLRTPTTPGRVSSALQTLRFSLSPQYAGGGSSSNETIDDEATAALFAQRARTQTSLVSAAWAFFRLIAVGASEGGGGGGGGSSGGSGGEKLHLISPTSGGVEVKSANYGALGGSEETAADSLESTRAAALR